MQVQRVLKLKLWQLRGIYLSPIYTKADDAAKALPVSELLYKENTGNRMNSKGTLCANQL